MSTDDELFDEVGLLLKSRPGWRYEPSTTPGAQPSWCLDPNGHITLGVTVIDGIHSVYITDEDREIDFDDREGLIRWIDQNAARFAGT